MNAKCWKKTRTIRPKVNKMKIGIHTMKTMLLGKYLVDQSINRAIIFILLLYKMMKNTNKNATANRTNAVIIFKAYFPSNPFGLSTNNTIAPIRRIKIAKNVDKTAIILGNTCTKTIQIIPIAKEIKRLNLIVS